MISLLRLLVPALLLGFLLGSPLQAAAPAVAAPPDTTVPVGEWPLRPARDVLEGFDPPEDPWGSGHRGVDLAGSPGALVRAALPGRISFAGVLAGRGVVVVDHGDTRTTYEPVAALVRVGDRVGAGEPIGRLELAASHCFPAACLHWGWKRGETYLDPLMLVGGGPIRLLPLWRERPVDEDLGGPVGLRGSVGWPLRPAWW